MVVFDDVSSMQKHLKKTISESAIKHTVKKVIENNIYKRVYQSYTPTSYVRTGDLLGSVRITGESIGNTIYTFEVFMDSSLIDSNITSSGEWNQHASMPQGGQVYDTSDYIPMWIEYGTEGSLWDRQGAYYMEHSHFDLDGGKLSQQLRRELSASGFKVIS